MRCSMKEIKKNTEKLQQYLKNCGKNGKYQIMNDFAILAFITRRKIQTRAGTGNMESTFFFFFVDTVQLSWWSNANRWCVCALLCRLLLELWSALWLGFWRVGLVLIIIASSLISLIMIRLADTEQLGLPVFSNCTILKSAIGVRIRFQFELIH